jgi:hypothetical protein
VTTTGTCRVKTSLWPALTGLETSRRNDPIVPVSQMLDEAADWMTLHNSGYL